MVRQNNIPFPSERRHLHSESQQIPAASELTCKSDSHSHRILNSTLYVMLMDGTHKLMIYTKGNRESKKGMPAQSRTTTYKLCQDNTHVSDGTHKK